MRKKNILPVVTSLNIKYDSAQGGLTALLRVYTPLRAKPDLAGMRRLHRSGGPWKGQGSFCLSSPVPQRGGAELQPRRTDLDALDALGHHVGVVHGHQRHLHARQPAQGPCPHSCRDNNPVLSSSPSPTAPDSCRGQGLMQISSSQELRPLPLCHPCPCALSPVPAQFTTQGVWMVPWAVSTACTLFTPKSSVLTWMPVTGQFSMIWWHRKGGQSHSRVTRAGGQPASPDMQPPNLGKVNLSSVLSALCCS